MELTMLHHSNIIIIQYYYEKQASFFSPDLQPAIHPYITADNNKPMLYSV
jgi:hypothetical protein